ncbi:putative bacteriocin export ABC transporter [uncultured Clostridium sp.]|uniref:putative bacteriocin export ABC transporter n=1 Tax=uncultured Clostridium sp. TaxID=59620 RepID=UPI002634D8C1|nr:putative bacteriocin export ABC transporter [uncultured Clostridium sp.]
MSILELDNIIKKFDEKIILNEFSMKVEKGELLAIVGKSGSGKSTLLNIMGLLDNFDSGDLSILGNKNIKINSKLSEQLLREKIGYLFQNFALIESKSVNYNIDLATKYLKLTKIEKNNLIKSVLNDVGLEDYGNKMIYELSGGEQQRVAIARLMVKKCDLILADEPTGSLDKENRDKIFSYLKNLQKNGKTIILVTHDEEIASKCDRMIKVVKGKAFIQEKII